MLPLNRLNRSKLLSTWASFWALFVFSTAAYAETIHAFGDDFADIPVRGWVIVAGTILAGVLARVTVGNPDASLPTGPRGVVAMTILSTVSGLIVFWICESYRTPTNSLSDGLEIALIFFASYNNRKVFDWLNEVLWTRMTAMWDAFIGRKSNGT